MQIDANDAAFYMQISHATVLWQSFCSLGTEKNLCVCGALFLISLSLALLVWFVYTSAQFSLPSLDDSRLRLKDSPVISM